MDAKRGENEIEGQDGDLVEKTVREGVLYKASDLCR
jgi:hypothetical protein